MLKESFKKLVNLRKRFFLFPREKALYMEFSRIKMIHQSKYTVAVFLPKLRKKCKDNKSVIQDVCNMVTKFVKDNCHVLIVIENKSHSSIKKNILDAILKSTNATLSDVSLYQVSHDIFLDFIKSENCVDACIVINPEYLQTIVLSNTQGIVIPFISKENIFGDPMKEAISTLGWESMVIYSDNIPSIGSPHAFSIPKPETYATIQRTYDIIIRYIVSKGYKTISDVRDVPLQTTITNIVIRSLGVGTQYHYGLKSKLFLEDYDYKQEWTWMLKSLEPRTLTDNPDGLFNIGYVDQEDRSGCHRFGWRYVYDNIKHLHNKNAPLLLDLYVDRTFLWDLEYTKIINIVPYRKPWVGFVHHTFNTSFSSNNCVNLFKCPEFLESLRMCKGLFVLSHYLKSQFEECFEKLQIVNVPLYVFTHPTDVNVPGFSLQKFSINTNPQVIQIGGWLRNSYLFYGLSLPNRIKVNLSFWKSIGMSLHKTVLMGKNMGNYHPCADFFLRLRDAINTEHTQQLSYNGSAVSNCYASAVSNCYASAVSNCYASAVSNCYASAVSNCYASAVSNCYASAVSNCGMMVNINNWYGHLYEDMLYKVKSVNIQNHVTNELYDEMLTNNIVFIYLVDASAVNTLIECIVRATPIFINKHPAVVEMLGDNYPLYVNGVCSEEVSVELSTILRDPNVLRQAHNHLRGIDKNRFIINSFCDSLVLTIKSFYPLSVAIEL